MEINMTILGFIGVIITLLIIVPASLVALIKVFTHPVREITNLWLVLIDTIIETIETIKTELRK
jgi:hypothetical protein